MTTFLLVLLFVVGGVLLLIVMLLAVPLGVRARSDEAGFDLRLVWLFGLVRIRLNGRKRDSGTGAVAARGKPARKARSRSTTSRRRRGPPPVPVIRRMIATAFRLVGRVRIMRFTLSLRLGTGDPADTGVILGALTPLVMLMRDRFGARLALTPAFDAAVVDLKGEAALRLVPITTLPPVLGFLLARDVRRWLRTRR